MANSLEDTPFLHAHCQTLKLQRENLQLSAGLCVTTASLARLQEDAPHFLHPEEWAYFTQISFAKRQHSYLLGRYAAKQAMMQYSATLTPTVVHIKNGVFENPIACYPSLQKIQISLSHSGPLGAALAFPEEHPMGIDIECIRAQPACLNTQFTLAENQWISQNDPILLPTFYTLFWAAKEALSKVLKTGMMSPFEIYALKNFNEHPLYWTSEFENFAQYQACLFRLGNSVCAIVYPQKTALTLNIQTIQQWLNGINLNHPDALVTT